MVESATEKSKVGGMSLNKGIPGVHVASNLVFQLNLTDNEGAMILSVTTWILKSRKSVFQYT